MRRWLLVAAGLALVIAAVAVGASRSDEGSSSTPVTSSPTSSRTPATSSRPSSGPPPFATAVSADGRFLVDQYGDPFLVRGDSPWSLMTDLSAAEVETYLGDRARRGVNAVIVSLLGSIANGGPSDDGATYDGVTPFVDGDITRWNEEYWTRARAHVRTAEEHGITVLLYPVDSWVLDNSFVPTDVDACTAYGAEVAERFADAPNVLWMAGGDYGPEPEPSGTAVDRCVNGVLTGVREQGDQRPFSVQLSDGRPMASTDNPYWRDKVDWNFVYTYAPTHLAVGRARAHEPAIPTIFGEGNYERENLHENQATTDETLRRQAAWALTSGAAGDVYGSDDWEFRDGWEGRLDETGLADVGHVRDVFAGLPWWTLQPDVDGHFLTTGRGRPLSGPEVSADVLDSDAATASVAPDGSAAAVYVPTERELTIDETVLAPGVRAAWVDPSTGRERPTTVRPDYRTPGENADGDEDWLLVFSPPAG